MCHIFQGILIVTQKFVPLKLPSLLLVNLEIITKILLGKKKKKSPFKSPFKNETSN